MGKAMTDEILTLSDCHAKFSISPQQCIDRAQQVGLVQSSYRNVVSRRNPGIQYQSIDKCGCLEPNRFSALAVQHYD